MLRLASYGALVTALALGCAAQTTSPSQDDSIATSALSTALPVWKPSSHRIELTSFGFWQGSSGYAKDRADLSPRQLATLEELRTTAPPTMEVHDGNSYRVRVFDEDGSVAEYRAAIDNVRDSDEGSSAARLPTLDMDTLQPFLSTFACVTARSAEGTTRKTDETLDPRKADLESAVKLPADPGCINGLFLPATCSDTLFTLDVREPETFEIVGGRCLERLNLRLYTDDGTSLLAQSSPGTNERCFTLQHTFDVGTYVLVLSKTNARGCSAEGAAGDTTLRLRRVQPGE